VRIAAKIVLGSVVALAAPGTVHALDERPVRSLLEARQHNVVIQEWDSSCGAAALATVLRFQLGDPVTERTVALGMIRGNDPDRIRGRGGFSLLDMKRLAEARGFSADGYADLSRGQLIKAAPAIVPIRSHAGDHFVVFRGVVRGQAILADPAFGNRSLPFAEFESRWKDRLAFVVRPKGGGANRLLASHRDLLRVGDDAERVAAEEKLPKPLSEWQLARIFAVDNAPLAPPQAIADRPPRSLRAARRDGMQAIPVSAPPQASGTPSPPLAAPGTASTSAPVAGSTISTSSTSGTASTLISGASSTVGGATNTVTGIVGTAIPSPAVALPGASIALPGASITLPATSITLPAPSITLPPPGR
jgi:uncharacterized protein